MLTRRVAFAAAAALLLRLIAQDVEEKPGGGFQVKSGTAKDRVLSVHDPEMRHGRKSASKRFNGHKAAVAVEMESQLITGVEVLAGNAGDQEKALELGQQSERVLQAKVEETVGDCAYGGGPTRRVFAEEERILTAKVPASHNRNCFSKSEFEIDLDQMEVRCPAGQNTRDYRSAGEGRGGQFLFPQASCQACPLRSQCVRGQGPRSISIQAEERLQQRARARNQTEAGRERLRERVVVEHRIARLVGLRDSPKSLLREKENPLAGGNGGGSGEPEFGGRVLPAAGSEHRRRHRSPGLGTAHPRFSGGPFGPFGPDFFA